MLILMAAALLAQAEAPPAALWENVSAGLGAAEARALYPAGDRVLHAADRITISGHRVSPDCQADVHIVHRGGTVGGVVLRGEPSIAGLCGTSVLEALTARHGAPLSAERTRPGLFKRARTTYVWNLGGVYLRYVHYAAGSGASAIADATNASWEMTLSTSAEPVRL